MKNIVLFTLKIYKGPVSIFLKSVLGVTTTCRFTPSCSDYTAQMINKFGIITGIKKGMAQFATCHPLGGGSYGTNI